MVAKNSLLKNLQEEEPLPEMKHRARDLAACLAESMVGADRAAKECMSLVDRAGDFLDMFVFFNELDFSLSKLKFRFADFERCHFAWSKALVNSFHILPEDLDDALDESEDFSLDEDDLRSPIREVESDSVGEGPEDQIEDPEVLAHRGLDEEAGYEYEDFLYVPHEDEDDPAWSEKMEKVRNELRRIMMKREEPDAFFYLEDPYYDDNSLQSTVSGNVAEIYADLAEIRELIKTLNAGWDREVYEKIQDLIEYHTTHHLMILLRPIQYLIGKDM